MIKIINNNMNAEGKDLRTAGICVAFTGVIGEYSSLFIKAYNTVIDLNDLTNTWSMTWVSPPTVQNYKEVDLEIKVINKKL